MSVKPHNFANETAPARHRGRLQIGGVRGRHYLDFVFHSHDEALAAPKLNCAFIDQASGSADGFVVVAKQRLKLLEITSGPNS
jgi:hypothetical protein